MRLYVYTAGLGPQQAALFFPELLFPQTDSRMPHCLSGSQNSPCCCWRKSTSILLLAFFFSCLLEFSREKKNKTKQKTEPGCLRSVQILLKKSIQLKPLVYGLWRLLRWITTGISACQMSEVGVPTSSPPHPLGPSFHRRALGMPHPSLHSKSA